ncbi:AMP-binding protein, partial [Achromobacter xylosoxidans]|uniref:AMP-binding protein n=1 Tax=Alcaligenes xylosoxydans xylosoxydans TaxID=85698 RepID=UPI0034D50904
MAWTDLTHLLLPRAEGAKSASVAVAPALPHADFSAHCLATASALRARATRRAALWFDDAAALAIALFACWRAGVTAVLPGDARPDTCTLLDADVDAWLTDTDLPPTIRPCWRLDALRDAPPLAPAALDPDQALMLCTSGSSGTPKRIAKRWGQLAREVQALQAQWPDATGAVLGSVSAQHMYGLPFRVLWPLCAGRPFDRR